MYALKVCLCVCVLHVLLAYGRWLFAYLSRFMRSVFVQGMHHVRFVIDFYCSAHPTGASRLSCVVSHSKWEMCACIWLFLFGLVYLHMFLTKRVICTEGENSRCVWRKGYIYMFSVCHDKNCPASLLVSICNCTDGTFIDWDAVENYKSLQLCTMQTEGGNNTLYDALLQKYLSN